MTTELPTHDYDWVVTDAAFLPHPDHVVMLIDANKTDANGVKYLRLGHTRLNEKLGSHWQVYGEGAQNLNRFTHWRHT